MLLTSAAPSKARSERSLASLIPFANSCIAEEVKNYFSDVTSCCYFEKIGNEENTEEILGALERGDLFFNGSGKGYTFPQYTEVTNLSSSRTRRRTIVEILQEGILSYENSELTSRTRRARGEKKVLDTITVDDTLPQKCCGYLYSASYSGPARTTILSCTLCSVLKGYYLIWAETQLRITVHRRPTFVNHKRCPSLGSRSPSTAQHILPLLLSQIRSQGQTWSSKVLPRPCQTAVMTPSLNGSKTSHGRFSDALSAPMTSTTVLSLHSVHFVHVDALCERRRDAFALQSMLHPRRRTVLECYPKHMIHFGLICYALWNATDACFTGERARTRFGPDSFEVSSLMTPTANSTVTQKSAILFAGGTAEACLLPGRDSDVVLVLGLGGNVLGQCLDALLPAAVGVHIVEVEPAVLNACVVHGQVPPLKPVPPSAVSCGAKPKPCKKSARPDEARAVLTPIEFVASEPHPRGSRYRIYLQDTFRFLESKNSYDSISSAVVYNMIFLDCYDPNCESMMHSQELLERCHQRLRPGGAVVINAHVLPKREVLEKQFLGHGFASVQVLRVSGLDQSIILCLRAPSPVQLRDGVPSFSTCAEHLIQRGRRFTLYNARAVAEYINQCQLLCQGEVHQRKELEGSFSPTHESSSFTLNHAWFKSCRLLVRSGPKQRPPDVTEAHFRKASSGVDDLVNLKRACIETESCRIWEHFT